LTAIAFQPCIRICK